MWFGFRWRSVLIHSECLLPINRKDICVQEEKRVFLGHILVTKIFLGKDTLIFFSPKVIALLYWFDEVGCF